VGGGNKKGIQTIPPKKCDEAAAAAASALFATTFFLSYIFLEEGSIDPRRRLLCIQGRKG
jgi:hypothetical protein